LLELYLFQIQLIFLFDLGRSGVFIYQINFEPDVAYDQIFSALGCNLHLVGSPQGFLDNYYKESALDLIS